MAAAVPVPARRSRGALVRGLASGLRPELGRERARVERRDAEDLEPTAPRLRADVRVEVGVVVAAGERCSGVVWLASTFHVSQMQSPELRRAAGVHVALLDDPPVGRRGRRQSERDLPQEPAVRQQPRPDDRAMAGSCCPATRGPETRYSHAGGVAPGSGVAVGGEARARRERSGSGTGSPIRTGGPVGTASSGTVWRLSRRTTARLPAVRWSASRADAGPACRTASTGSAAGDCAACSAARTIVATRYPTS